MDEALNMDAAYEGVKRLGLPPNNTAADRAKAMGFSDDTYYHGSLKDIKEFDPNLASIEGHLGKSIYVTDNPKDASVNYASLSAPDILHKAQKYADTIEHNDLYIPSKPNKELNRIKKLRRFYLGKPPKTETLVSDNDLRQEFLQDFKDNDGVVYPLAIKKGNELDVRRPNIDNNEEVFIDFNPKFDKYGEEIIEESKNLTNLQNSLYKQARKYDFNYDAAARQLDDFYDAYLAKDLNNNLRGNSILQDATTESGESAASEIRRQIFEDMGYDSVKLNANDEFSGMMNESKIYDQTNHHMIFNPAYVRSKLAKFNPKYAGVGAGSIMSADLLANETNQPTSLLGYDPQTMEPLFAPPEQSHINLDNLKSLDKEFLKKLAEGTYDFGKEMVLDPSVMGEVVGTGLLKGMGVASPYIKGMGIGGLLMPSDISASQKFYNEEDLKRLRNR